MSDLADAIDRGWLRRRESISSPRSETAQSGRTPLGDA
jgi:hypothetical protein